MSLLRTWFYDHLRQIRLLMRTEKPASFNNDLRYLIIILFEDYTNVTLNTSAVLFIKNLILRLILPEQNRN